jgi:hypothetical protein
MQRLLKSSTSSKCRSDAFVSGMDFLDERYWLMPASKKGSIQSIKQYISASFGLKKLRFHLWTHSRRISCPLSNVLAGSKAGSGGA